MHVDAVVVAAGSSVRFGDGDKLTAKLCGQPVLGRAIAAIAGAASVERIVLVAGPGREEELGAIARQHAGGKLAAVVAGGARRRDSVQRGLHVAESRYVAIHDGARPLVTPDTVEACIAAAEGRPGAIAATPVTDTIKEVADSVIVGHPDRTRLWAAQTPQVVLRQAWLDAAATSDDDETDDAAMLARLGHSVAVVDAGPENLKITRPADLLLAEAILTSRAER